MGLVVLTGASGSGKTTIAQAFAARYPTLAEVHFFDRITVPSLEDMTIQYGSPDEWQRVEAWRRNSRRRDCNDAVDMVGRETGLFDRRGRGIDEQLLGRLQIDSVAVMPAVTVHVPILRSDDVTPGDPRIVEYAREAIEQRLVAAKCFPRADLGFGLLDDIRRNRSGE
jgi:energy-coupling factor transporter ATP-binding protein EcfA2